MKATVRICIRWALTFDVRGRRSGEAAKGTHKRSLWAVPLDGIVERSRYAEDSRLAAARNILHVHPPRCEGVIVRYFVRINQHDKHFLRALRCAISDALEAP